MIYIARQLNNSSSRIIITEKVWNIVLNSVKIKGIIEAEKKM